MTGLEKILTEITGEAKAEAEAILQKARVQAEEAAATEQTAAKAKAAEILQEADKTVQDIQRAGESGRALQRRQRILAQKQMLLDETMQKALEALRALPADEYFALLCRLAAASAEQGEGEMLLSEEDKARLPAGFAETLAAALPKGAKLAVAETTRKLDGGFILKYGDIEQNCSFAAMFDARREEFADKIQGILFL